MSDLIRRHFYGQAKACRLLGSPFTARLLGLAAERLDHRSEVGSRLLGWSGNTSDDAIALRFAAALHALVLSGERPALAEVWPPHEADADVLWRAVVAAMQENAAQIVATLGSPPQTNEVSRSSVLLPGLLFVAQQTGLPLELSEIGASAGLNLHCDRWRYATPTWRWGDPDAGLTLAPDWTGPPPPVDAPFRIVGRRGCDRSPRDPSNPADSLRLRSYIWPDQTDRLARFSAALNVAAMHDTRVEHADAERWLANRLAGIPCDGVAHVVYHTIVWQYLPKDTRERISAALEAAGRQAVASRPLAWLRLEPDEVKHGAGLRLTLWPGGRTTLLARGDFHGRWIEWLV